MTAYYNEIDPYAVQWLRNLIAAGHIAAGGVDERSILDVRPDDVRPYRQCHFFAGIGGWSLALRLAGWDDERPAWTGSCPCQPLSSAGKRHGHADERHLWPAFHGLIAECRPPMVFGEQVAGKDGREWLSAVRADLEGCGYAVGAANLPACGVGAPHIRQRLWFVADADAARCRTGRPGEARNDGAARLEPSGLRADGQWSDLTWLPCTDGKARPTQPGLFPLVDGSVFRLGSGSSLEGKSRVNMLRAAGNAIVPSVAAEFIKAYLEC